MALAESSGWLPGERTEFLIGVVGGVKALARILGVSASQPSRWRRGIESPGPVAARRLLDLDHVAARAMLVWDVSLLEAWLTGPNPHLGGLHPVEVLITQGAGPVLRALDAEAAGAFA